MNGSFTHDKATRGFGNPVATRLRKQRGENRTGPFRNGTDFWMGLFEASPKNVVNLQSIKVEKVSNDQIPVDVSLKITSVHEKT